MFEILLHIALHFEWSFESIFYVGGKKLWDRNANMFHSNHNQYWKFWYAFFEPLQCQYSWLVADVDWIQLTEDAV